MPSRGLGDAEVNPFWSQKAQDEFRLAASRPGDLPTDLDRNDSREPIQSAASGLAVPPSFTDLTGKGWGGILPASRKQEAWSHSLEDQMSHHD